MILYKNPIDPPGTPVKTGYTSPVSKNFNDVSPFLTNWLNNPITRAKLKQQANDHIADDVINKLKQVTVVDLDRLAQAKRQGKDYAPELAAHLGHTSDRRVKGVGKMLNNFALVSDVVNGVYLPGRSDVYKTVGAKGVFDPNDLRKSSTHEVVHLSGLQDPIESYILKKWGSKQVPIEEVLARPNHPKWLVEEQYRKLGKSKRDADGRLLKFHEGAYPRLIQVREALQLKPGQKVTPEMLRNFKPPKGSTMMKGLLSNWDYETLAEIFNDVAVNDKTPQTTPGNNEIEMISPLNMKQEEYIV